MIPLSLTIAGFLSYQDPVEIDFSGIDLVCITGDNGAGKSTILDAITWVLFGRARKHDESIINLNSETAEVNLEFAYEDSRYRVIRINPRGKTKTVEFFIQGPQESPDQSPTWIPLTERTIRETDQKIIDVLRLDYETFINAVFFLQGEADQFTIQTPSARKQILSKILNLDIWETYKQRARQHGNRLTSKLMTLEDRMSNIQNELASEEERRSTLEALQAELDQAVQEREAQEKVLEEMRGRRAALEEQRKLVEALRGQLTTTQEKLSQLTARIQERELEQDKHQKLIEKKDEVERKYQEWQAAQNELSEWDKTAENFHLQEKKRQGPLTTLAAEEARLTQEISDLETQQAALQQLVSKLPTLEEEVARETEFIQEAETRLKERDQTKSSLEEARQQLADARAENPRLMKEMKELERRIQELSDTEGATCPLCGQQLPPEERAELVESLKRTGKDLGDRYRSNQKLLEEADQIVRERQVKITKLSAAEKDLRSHNKKADQLENQITEIKSKQSAWESGPGKKLADHQRVVEEKSFAPQARKELEAIHQTLKEIGYDAARHDQVKELVAEGDTIQQQIRALDQAQAALTALDREIADLKKQHQEETDQLSKQIQTLEESQQKLETSAEKLPSLDQAEQALRELREKENILQRNLGAAQQKVSVLETQKQKRDQLEQERGQIAEQIKLTSQLEDAFGKNGVPALLIEQALPQIETRANQILNKLSGGTMSIHFLTQTPYRDAGRSDKKETLEIQIKDQAGIREYELYSGGESFRINFAVRLAISHLLTHRAGARLQTLVIDEGFGSQDLIGRQRLIEAINLVRGDFKKILVITHVEEIKEVFSTQFLVEKTPRGSQVTVL